MSSKKIKRDERGHPILPGAITFGTIVRPKNNKGRAIDLRDKADTRLLLLIKKRVVVDKFTRLNKSVIDNNERKSLEFQKEFAEAPKIAHIAHYNNKLNDLICELKKLEESGNERKISLMKESIESEIKEYRSKIREAYSEIYSD
jgi:hypothetical protein